MVLILYFWIGSTNWMRKIFFRSVAIIFIWNHINSFGCTPMSFTFLLPPENLYSSSLILKTVERWLLIFCSLCGQWHRHSLHNNNNEMVFYFQLQHASSVCFTEPRNVWFPGIPYFNILEHRQVTIKYKFSN